MEDPSFIDATWQAAVCRQAGGTCFTMGPSMQQPDTSTGLPAQRNSINFSGIKYYFHGKTMPLYDQQYLGSSTNRILNRRRWTMQIWCVEDRSIYAWRLTDNVPLPVSLITNNLVLPVWMKQKGSRHFDALLRRFEPKQPCLCNRDQYCRIRQQADGFF